MTSFLETGTLTTEEARLLEQSCASPFALIVVQSPTPRTQLEFRVVTESLESSHIPFTPAFGADFVIVLVPHADARTFVNLAIDKGKISKYKAAISLPFNSCEDIPRQYELLKYCLDSQSTSGIYDVKDCALAYLVSEISRTTNVEGLLHPALAKLASYDAANQSNLLNTLKVYLELDRNAQRCANSLYLHRNSLQYRMRRIQEIADIDLDDPAERSYLRLSFLLS